MKEKWHPLPGVDFDLGGYDEAANAANTAQKRIAELEAENAQLKEKNDTYRAELSRAAQLIPCAGPVSHRIQVLMAEYGEGIRKLRTELATLRAQAKRDAAVVEALTPKSYSYDLEHATEARIPENILDAMSVKGWNAFGIFELVRDEMLKGAAAVRARREAGEGEDVNDYEIKWRTIEPGFNVLASSVSVGNYCTGDISSGWVLYSRRRDGVWEQRTEREFAPVEGLVPRKILGCWMWSTPGAHS